MATFILLHANLAWAQDDVKSDGPAGVGSIAGKIVDRTTGDAVIDAGVEVVGTGKQTRTDIDGHFILKVPPGTHEIRIFASGYEGTRIKNIKVTSNGVAHADAALNPATGQGGVEVVEVVAQANKAAEATQILKRQKSEAIEDNVSAQIIQKSPDSNAAEVVERVPAVTVRNNKYVYIRGLGERYSSALLNGCRLPSTDPDRRVIPLDLFPTQFIESLSVIKTYEPNLPGDFAGGLVDIQLRDFPDKLSYTIGMQVGGNTNSTFQPFNTYDGGTNYFPSFVPPGTPSAIPKTNINSATPGQLQAYGRAFPNNWSIYQKTAPPNFGVNASVGNTIGPFGFSLAGLYTTEYKSRWQEIAKQFKSGTNPENPTFNLIDDYTVNSGVFETRIGLLLTSGYDINPDNRISFRAFYNQNTYTESDVAVGFSEPLNIERTNRQTLEQFTQDGLAYGQLEGKHHFSPVDVNWRSAFSQTTQDIPDTRIVIYNGDPGALSFTQDANSGVRAFQNLRELLSFSAVDFTVPFTTGLPGTDWWSGMLGKVKFGPAYSYQTRTYSQRIFHFRPGPLLAGDLGLPPSQLFAPGNIGPGKFTVVEETLPRDNFDANQEIAGGYAMVDTPIVNNLVRLVAGVRVEYSYIVAKFFDDIHDRPASTIKNNTDPLPAVGVIVEPRSDMSVRANWSQTVSRPDFRELSPTEYPTLRGFRPIIGNPNLVEAHITNWDLRWDWFLSPLELLSASFFHKNLDQPIEKVILQQASNVADSFENAESATLTGFEVEARKNLGTFSNLLDRFSVIGNVAYIDSNVVLPPNKQFQVQSTNNRPLQGQAPWIFNAAVEYEHPQYGTSRLLYNAEGPKITALGSFGLPDIYEQSRQELDFVWLNDVTLFNVPVTMKLSAENLLDDRYEFTQGPQLQARYNTGVKLTFGISYQY